MRNIGKRTITAPIAFWLPRRRVAAALLLIAAIAPWTVARAGDFPDKPIRFILGFGVGGPTDIVAHTLADQLTKELGQNVVVENKPGASGNIATQTVAGADPDGYTFLIGANPLAVNESLFPDLPVKFGRDLIAVAPIGATANVLVVQPSLNLHNLTDLTQRARSKPDAISYATIGVGSSSHLAGVAFDLQAGTKMLAVEYHGGGDALKDLLGGQVDAWFAAIPSVLGAIQSGQLVALATTGPQRVSWLPDTPTMAESGFPGFDIRLWVGVFARSGVPVERIRVIEQAIVRAMASKDMQDTLERQGITPLSMSGTDFGAFVTREIERWKPVVATFTK